MTATEDKVKFNLKNAHYAIWDATTKKFLTPVAVPGSVSLSMDPQGDVTPEYADGIVYYTTTANQGYSGDWELERVTDQMRQDIWGDTLNTDGVLVENANTEPKTFALLFQIDGDQAGRDMVLYNCTATRPSVGGATNNETKQFTHDTCTITAVPMSDGKVKAATTATTTDAIKTAWFDSVYVGA